MILAHILLFICLSEIDSSDIKPYVLIKDQDFEVRELTLIGIELGYSLFSTQSNNRYWKSQTCSKL
jgi:hypothetical protein